MDLPKARKHLEHAVEVLRFMEGIDVLLDPPRRQVAEKPAEPGLKAAFDFDTCESSLTAEWLLDTFTESTLEAAEDQFELQMSRRSSMLVRRPAPQFEPRTRCSVMSATTSAILEKCGGLNFNALDLAAALEGAEQRPLPVFGAHVLRSQGDLISCIHERAWVTNADTFSQTFLSFLNKLDCLYRPEVRYHNSSHAVDVMASMDMFMRAGHVTQRTTSLDHLMGLAAAAMHDVGHPGTNALFQTKTMSSLAIRYNDNSILENMHASLAFHTMQQDPSCNWVALLAKDAGTSHQVPNLQQYVRQGLISMVLATDMAKHQKYVQQLASSIQHSAAAPASPSSPKGQAGLQPQEKLDDKLFLLDTLLHAADLSNPAKPREIALAWSRRVNEEFWLQGDEERRLGLAISPMCDREAGMAVIPQSQLGFINFVVRPLYNPLAELVAEAEQFKEQMAENVAFWEEKKGESATFEQLFGDAPAK